MKKIGIWGNTEKRIFWDIFPKILSWADKNELQPYITKRISGKVSSDLQIINSKNDFNKVDFMLSLGEMVHSCLWQELLKKMKFPF